MKVINYEKTNGSFKVKYLDDDQVVSGTINIDKDSLNLNALTTKLIIDNSVGDKVKITKAYKLPCKRIIHTVGPMFHSNPDKAPQLLKNCYLNSMKLAEQYRMENNLDKISIAFPCISTGIYGYPKDEACKLAIDTIKEINNPNIEVKFVCFGELDYKLYLNKLNGIDKGVFELED